MRRVFAILFLITAPLTLFAVPVGAATSDASVVFPTVSGGYGTTPTITFPSGPVPSALGSKVLVKGHGAVVKKGELLVANYVGQIWNGKVFDSSFSRQEVAAFPIGIGAVIKGWDETLVGQSIGSRVLLVIPPSLGYGTSGNSGAGITGTDTLTFVVDVVAAYAKGIGSTESSSLLNTNVHGLTLADIRSSAPKITVAKGTKKPTAISTMVVARGNGAKAKAGMLILQFVVNDWTNKLVTSTWKTGTPDGEYVGSKANPSLFDALIGDRLGSRVIIELPANSNGGPYVLEVQIAAEVPAAASRT